MFFKKRKEKKERELGERRLQTEKDFAEAVQKAERIEDPAEKVIALQKIQAGISRYIRSENSAISTKANDTGGATFLGGSLSTLGGSMAGGLLLGGPVGAAVIGVVGFGGVVGSIFAAEKREANVKKKLQLSAADHIGNLRALSTQIAERVGTVIESDLEAFSKSPSFANAKAWPDVASKFMEAAQKHITTPREAPAADEKAAPETEAKAAEEKKAPRQQRSDASKLKGAINNKPKK